MYVRNKKGEIPMTKKTPTTEKAEYVFVIKESGTGTPWIMCESYHGELSILEKGYLSLRLNPGTSYEQAQEIARFLNDKIACLSFTHHKQISVVEQASF
jgi:hypothetical protein